MKTAILIGTPKNNIEKSGSYLIAKAFISNMKDPCEIFSIQKESREKLVSVVESAKNIIVITPNYIHSVPAGVVEFLHQMPRAKEGQSIAFIVQSGYEESKESEVICRYLKRRVESLGYCCLATIAKGGCAGLGIMPEMMTKVLDSFSKLGILYDTTGSFDKTFLENFQKPFMLSKSQMFFVNAMGPISRRLGWDKILKANNGYEKRKDMPYL